mgnify:CR=1 FL=1
MAFVNVSSQPPPGDIIEDMMELYVPNEYVAEQVKKNDARTAAAFKMQDIYAKQIGAKGSVFATGQTGQSTRRRGTIDYAKYGRDVSEIARKLTLNDRELARKSSAAISKYKAFKDQAFVKVAFKPIPDVAPPQPVMRNVGAEAFMEGLSIASNVMSGLGAMGVEF